MKFEIVLGVVLILIVVAALRFQYHWVAGKVTNEDAPERQVVPVSTPFEGLCGKQNQSCSFPALQPTIQPFRGLTAP